MSNTRSFALFLLVCVAAAGFLPQIASAQDRSGYVGQSVLFPVGFEPETKKGDTAYAIDIATALSERWFARASFEFGLQGQDRISAAFGPEVFFRLRSAWKPFLTAQAIYVLSPSSEFGVRGDAGLEWDLRTLTGIDNLRLTAMTGILAIFDRHIPNEMFYEAIRLGLAWNY